ncbi:MAG: hypothetical protein P8X51_00285 [Maritimibacter sp.]
MTRELFSIRNLIYGLLTWAVPFFAAFAFYTREGQLATDIFLFKTAMILIGGLTGAWLLTRAFRTLPPSFASGLALGLFWAALNWALDLVVLVGLMGSPFGSWLVGVGLRYLMLPIMASAMGAVGAAARG